MIDFAETERMDYAKALEIAENDGDAALVEKLKATVSRYYGKDVTWKSAVYLNYLSGIMRATPKFTIPVITPFVTSLSRIWAA